MVLEGIYRYKYYFFVDESPSQTVLVVQDNYFLIWGDDWLERICCVGKNKNTLYWIDIQWIHNNIHLIVHSTHLNYGTSVVWVSQNLVPIALYSQLFNVAHLHWKAERKASHEAGECQHLLSSPLVELTLILRRYYLCSELWYCKTTSMWHCFVSFSICRCLVIDTIIIAWDVLEFGNSHLT